MAKSTESLKKLAKECYFAEVRVESWREQFLKDLERVPIIDRRNLGWYCIYCKAFTKKHSPHKQEIGIVFEKDVNDKVISICIVNKCYDDCEKR